MLSTDKQQDFELNSSFDLIDLIVLGSSADTIIVINKLIATIKRVALRDQPDQNQQDQVRNMLIEQLDSCYLILNQLLIRH